MRVFSANPKIPVIAACDICGVIIKFEQSRDPAGHVWVDGNALVKGWFDHQLIDCKVGEPVDPKEGDDEENSVCR